MRVFAGVEVYDDAPVAHSGSSEKIANASADIDAGVPHMNVGLGATHSKVFVDASDVTPYRMRMWYDSVQMTCPVWKVPSLSGRDVPPYTHQLQSKRGIVKLDILARSSGAFI
jgi:hypothetical protein